MGHLVSPRRDRNRGIYNWHAFKHGYSKELVDKIIEYLDLKKDAWVLDPFCGGGTTLLACRDNGMNSQGYDILPFSVFLTNVKLREYNLKRLKNLRDLFVTSDLSKTTRIPTGLKDIKIIPKAFTDSVLKELCMIKNWIEEINTKEVKDFFTLAFLNTAVMVSSVSKAGGFLRIINRSVPSNTVRKHFLANVDKMLADLSAFQIHRNRNTCIASARLADARNFKDNRKYDAIIMSPPYPNRHDYTRIYQLELALGFVPDNESLKRIRYRTLRSHVEARKRYSSDGFEKPSTLVDILNRLGRKELNNSSVLDMLEGYFEDMFLVLRRLFKSLKKNGAVALVVSNVRFAGVSVPVDTLLVDIAKGIGFERETVWVLRYRGNSSQQMRDFEKKSSRESLVILRK